MEIQKLNNLPPILRKLSESEVCKMLMADDNIGVSKALPTSVKSAIGQPPICDVSRVVGRPAIVRYVEWELIRLAARLSVSGNLTDGQVQFISTQLVEMFPNESLADFKLCFERGAIGQYGEIYRMDGIVLRKWLEQYFDEKYQVIEDELMKEKENEYKKTHPEGGKDWLKIWAEAIGDKNKVPQLTDEDIRAEGQPKPKKSEYIPDPTRIAEHKKKLRMAREIAIREKYPELTDEKVSELISQMPEL